MKLRWVTPTIEGAGNVLGYGTLVRELRAALEAKGVHFTEDADTALHVRPPTNYEPIPGVRNVLFSMWETESIPAPMRKRLADTDLVVTPCAWNVHIFAQYVTCPVVVCPLGSDPAFTPVTRTWKPGTPFRWLHVGAPTGRKGADVLQECWARWWRDRTDAQLVLKTTIADVDRLPEIRAELLRGRWLERAPLIFAHGNLTLNLRMLPKAELVQLYHQAHGFVFPTGGEGWGFVLADALSTALPSLCTRVGGHLDFTTDQTVTYLDWTLRRSRLEGTGDQAGLVVDSAWVAPVDCSAAMDQMMRDYPAAVRRARWGARQVQAFTWARTAQTLLGHLHARRPAAHVAA